MSKHLHRTTTKNKRKSGCGGYEKCMFQQEITCDMCSAAATLGLTTSQFAMTRVFGTLPSVCLKRQQKIKPLG